ncbi:MAG: FMN-binding protein, partial [Myxococcota bacterium]
SRQVEAIEKAARSVLPTRLVTIHRGWQGDRLLGYAHIDVHTVRTKPEAFMVVLGPEAVIQQVRVLAFHEPLEYMPADRWYRTFFGQTREADLRIGFDVDAVTGATLTTRATIDSVRRMLAYYDVLLEDDDSSKSTEPDTVVQEAGEVGEGGG